MSDTLNTLIADLIVAELGKAGLPEDETVHQIASSVGTAVAAALQSGTPTETDAETKWAWENDCGEIRMCKTEAGARDLAARYNGTARFLRDGLWVKVPEVGIPSRTLVAESNADLETLADLIAAERDKYPRKADDMDSEELAGIIIAAGFRRPVMDAADVWDAGFDAGFVTSEGAAGTPNPYRGGTT